MPEWNLNWLADVALLITCSGPTTTTTTLSLEIPGTHTQTVRLHPTPRHLPSCLLT